MNTKPQVTLHCGDWRELDLSQYTIDAIITDPPYGIKIRTNYHTYMGKNAGRYSNDYPAIHGDDSKFDPSPLLAMNVPTVLWGANYYADRLPPVSGWIVWDKIRDGMDQAAGELAWTNWVKGLRVYRHQWNGFLRESERGENYHPTQKPVALMDWIINLKWFPRKDGMTIFDPYMGGGPVGVAAVKNGLNYIGCEIEPQYFEIAKRRIDAALMQPALL